MVNDFAVKPAATIAPPDPDYCFAHNWDRGATVCSDFVSARCYVSEVIILGSLLIEMHWYDITLGSCVNLET